MKIPVIKLLVETHSCSELGKAEMAIIEENELPFDVAGDDEGEQLTHVIAARWILDRMNKDGADFKTALRAYTQKVRESIN